MNKNITKSNLYFEIRIKDYNQILQCKSIKNQSNNLLPNLNLN